MASLLSPKPVWRKSKRSHIEVNRTVVTKVLSASISGSKVENFDSAVSVVFAIDKV